jgi:hypothetical protein
MSEIKRSDPGALLDQLRAAAAALVANLATSPSVAERLTEDHYVEVSLGNPPAAWLVVDGKPLLAVEAAAWPAGFGEALAVAVEQLVGRLPAHARRRVAAALESGAAIAVVIRPIGTAEVFLDVLVESGSARVRLGDLAPDGARC